ncbi:hypothetical protein LLG46_08305 [bacterium]|nr:hypothetical protein [bacterium]
MPEKKYPTLIHERVALARAGENPTVICRMRSGWVVLGDDQRLRGYTLLLADPICDNLNDLSFEARTQFLLDMSIVGDALMETLDASLINYSILGNLDRALHVHIHPRYDHEAPEDRRHLPFIYGLRNDARVDFNLERDRHLMSDIRDAIAKRTEIIS